MKKIIMVMIMMCMGFAFCACGSGSESESVDNSNATETSAEVEDTSKATIGSYEVTIKDYELIQDDEGKDAIMVSFEFTNNSEENISPDYAVYEQCFQNGVELELGTIYIGEETTDPLYENSYREIQPGTTIETKECFILQDKENPVTVEVVSMNELLGGDSEGSAKKEFEIAE